MVLVVIGILVGVATPSMKTMIERNRTQAQVSALYGTLMMARSESITRNQPAVLCMSSNGSSCTTSGNWEQGWLLYVDEDNDGTFGSSEELIRASNALVTNYTLRAVAPLSTTVTFRANGTTPDSGSFRLCPPSQNTDDGYSIVLTITGRARLSEGVDACP